jgi:hypothetical protein
MIPNLASEITRQMCDGYLKHIDDVFVKALQDHGLPSTEEFIKVNIVCIRVEGDKFDHYWYHHGQSDGKRIISIEHEPTMRLEEPTGLSNNYKQVIEAKYY